MCASILSGAAGDEVGNEHSLLHPALEQVTLVFLAGGSNALHNHPHAPMSCPVQIMRSDGHVASQAIGVLL